MRILITGGAGFIGSHVAELCLEKGHRVAVLDNLRTGKRTNIPAEAVFFEADVLDAKTVTDAFRAFRPEAVSHQAAQASVSESVKNPSDDASVNILGGLNVLRAAREAEVKTFVFASTGGAIYGQVPEGTRAKVGAPLLPASPYGVAKLAFEHYLRIEEHSSKMNLRILRYANVYGPRQDPFGEAGVVAIFMHRIGAGRPVQINAARVQGDGGCIRDYVFVKDVARANLFALEGRLPEAICNVGTGLGTNTETLLDLIRTSLRRPVTVTQTPHRAGDIVRSVLDPEPIEKVLGTLTPLEQGLRSTLASHRG